MSFSKVVAEKQLNEYMVLSDFDFSSFCHGGKSLGSGKHKCHIVYGMGGSYLALLTVSMGGA